MQLHPRNPAGFLRMNVSEGNQGPNQKQRTFPDIPSIGASSLHGGVYGHGNRPPWRCGVWRNGLWGGWSFELVGQGGGSPSTNGVCVMGSWSDKCSLWHSNRLPWQTESGENGLRGEWMWSLGAGEWEILCSSEVNGVRRRMEAWGR